MRSHAVLLLTTAALLGPTALQAQQWDEQQREVLDAVLECWDLWMDAVQQGTPDPWLDNCQADEVTFWIGTEGSPILDDTEFLRRNWGGVVGVDLGWVDLRPIAIRVHDDVAVLHFYGLWRLPGDEVEEWRRTEVWRMIDGRWRQWAGHVTPVDDDD